MENLKEQIKENLKIALKEGRSLEVSVLRMVLASIVDKEKEKRYKLAKEEPKLTEKKLQEKSRLAEEEIVEVLFFELKKRRDSIDQFKKGNRQDLVEKEKTELEILKRYLPEQLSEKKIEKIAKEIIKKVGADGIKDMGKVMGALMPKVKGKAEGSTVSKIVKKLLS